MLLPYMLPERLPHRCDFDRAAAPRPVSRSRFSPTPADSVLSRRQPTPIF